MMSWMKRKKTSYCFPLRRSYSYRFRYRSYLYCLYCLYCLCWCRYPKWTHWRVPPPCAPLPPLQPVFLLLLLQPQPTLLRRSASSALRPAVSGEPPRNAPPKSVRHNYRIFPAARPAAVREVSGFLPALPWSFRVLTVHQPAPSSHPLLPV